MFLEGIAILEKKREYLIATEVEELGKKTWTEKQEEKVRIVLFFHRRVNFKPQKKH